MAQTRVTIDCATDPTRYTHLSVVGGLSVLWMGIVANSRIIDDMT